MQREEDDDRDPDPDADPDPDPDASMSSTPDEVSRLLARTRANRERINRHLEGVGEATHPIRSPLKEKQTAPATETEKPKSPEKEKPAYLVSRNQSPSKIAADAAKEDLVCGLKAKGFEECTSSKIGFEFRKEVNPKKEPLVLSSPKKPPLVLSSPTRSVAEPSPASPSKPHPLQFVSPQVMAASASPHQRSPQKPSSPKRPLTPKRSLSPAKTTIADFCPPKPARTWAADNKESETPSRRLVPEKPMADTAARKSLSEKRSMFEGAAEDETVSSVDPSMLTMAQRRALFEKSRTAPKPVARFGDAVTPSMLAR